MNLIGRNLAHLQIAPHAFTSECNGNANGTMNWHRMRYSNWLVHFRFGLATVRGTLRSFVLWGRYRQHTGSFSHCGRSHTSMARCTGEWPLSLPCRTNSNVATCRMCRHYVNSSLLVPAVQFYTIWHTVWKWSEEGQHITPVARHEYQLSVRVDWPALPTGGLYLQFLQNASRASMWLVRDQASEYLTRQVCECVDPWFPQKWIVPGEPLPRPARLPYLSPVDYAKWGYLKEFRVCYIHGGPECPPPCSERCSRSRLWITKSIASIVGIRCATWLRIHNGCWTSFPALVPREVLCASVLVKYFVRVF
jgi:hypothetical protein